MAKQSDSLQWQSLERAIARDPGRRGLACRAEVMQCVRGQLRAASEGLAHGARAVAIATGFAVPLENGGWTAETDGPPGALLLARCLLELGVDVRLISDPLGTPLLEAAVDSWRWPREMVLTFPSETSPTQGNVADVVPPAGDAEPFRPAPLADRWIEQFWSSPFGQSLTHLIAIERVGPSHRLDSLRCQAETCPSIVRRFQREVPPSERDVCHNMRGQSIHAQSGQIHRLFETAARRHTVTTIGIGDGGNEIGMGRVAWGRIADALPSGVGGRIACRVSADCTLIAGVSDWAAYALAAATSCLRGAPSVFEQCRVDTQRRLIETLVERAGAVDGVTRRHEATVDGLPLETYLQPLVAIRGVLGLGSE